MGGKFSELKLMKQSNLDTSRYHLEVELGQLLNHLNDFSFEFRLLANV